MRKGGHGNGRQIDTNGDGEKKRVKPGSLVVPCSVAVYGPSVPAGLLAGLSGLRSRPLRLSVASPAISIGRSMACPPAESRKGRAQPAGLVGCPSSNSEPSTRREVPNICQLPCLRLLEPSLFVSEGPRPSRLSYRQPSNNSLLRPFPLGRCTSNRLAPAPVVHHLPLPTNLVAAHHQPCVLLQCFRPRG